MPDREALTHQSVPEPLVIPGEVGSYFLDRDAPEYRKTATIRAMRIDEPFTVQSREGDHQGAAGDWLAQGPAGELWVIAADVFAATYARVDDA